MKKKLVFIALLILLCLSLFYLFVVPVIAILNPEETPIFDLAFGLFMLAQLIMLNLEIGYIVIKSFYQLKTDRYSLFFNRIFTHRIRKTEPLPDHPVLRVGTVLICFLCYLITIYVFAVAYMYLSGFDANSFSAGSQLGLIDSIYFSLVTATTVGYGDIHPISAAAKIMVMFEIVIALMYVVVIFSSIASFLKKEPEPVHQEYDGISKLRGYRLSKHLTSQSTPRLRRRTR